MSKNPVIIVATMLVIFCSNVAFGFDPMGPPKAVLSKGQPSWGIEYLYGKMDIEAGAAFGLSEVDIKDIEINRIYGTVGYGFSNDLEIFARVGVAAADVDRGANTADHFGALIGSSDFGLLIGGGARATLFTWKDISVGLLAQVSLVQLDDFDGNSGTLWGEPTSLSTELSMTEVQLAVGPTWNCTEDFSIYGGPFLHFIDGTADLTATTAGFSPLQDSVDISQRGVWGGYIGASMRFCESPNINCNVEFQATGAGYGAAIQLVITP